MEGVSINDSTTFRLAVVGRQKAPIVVEKEASPCAVVTGSRVGTPRLRLASPAPNHYTAIFGFVAGVMGMGNDA
jgi:hypothetical protein